MASRDDRRRNGQAAKDVVIVTRDELDHFVNSLSVVQGYTQLLQRRLRQGHSIEQAELRRTLNLIENASRSIKTRLDVLGSTVPLTGPGSDPE